MGLRTVEFNEKPCLTDGNQAIAIAEKEFIRVYGEQVMEQKPFVATLVKDTVWVVKGTFHNNSTKTRRGGVARAEINANNCQIIKIIHGK